MEKNILSLKEKPELLKNLAMLIFNDKEIDIKFVDDLVEMIKKNRTMLDYILLVANNTKGFPVIFKIIHNFLHYHNETMELLLNFNYVFPFIFDFLKYFNIKIIDYFFYILIDKDFLELTKKLGLIIIKNETILDNLFGIFEDNKLIAIFENKIQTKEYINNIFNGILDVIYKNETIIDIIKDILDIYFQREMKNLRFARILTNFLRLFFLFYTKNNENELHSKMSPGCLGLLNYTFFGHVNDELKNNSIKYLHDEKISHLYWYKFVVDSTKDKNDFLTFYNCLYSKPLFNISEENYRILDHQPTFIISIVDLTKLIKTTIIKRVNTYFEDNHFTLGFCLPQGIETNKNLIKNITEKDDDKYYICKNTDYEYLSKLILSYIFSVNEKDEIKVKAIEIRKEKNDKNYLIYFAKLIPLFIFFIPIFIDIFLFFYKGCAIKMKKKTLMFKKINQIRDDESDNEEEEEDDKDKNANNKKRKNIKFIKLVPRWYKILDEFFSLKNNAKELFCFSTDFTDINNNTGLVYIKGLIGISILLMIIGQLYLILLNLPTKEFGKYQFSELISNPFYIFPFIGLRYSPRILFSCSGFTLTHKFLSYISQNSGCKHIFKFVFCQFYKYLILINLILFARFSMQHITFDISEESPMWKIFYEVELSLPKETSSFIYKLLSNRIYFFTDILLNNHDFMDYCWVSFNEVFFFIIGTSLLSIGYKCNLKIDYLILILILLIYGCKIAFYHCNFFFDREERKFFATLYYYLYDYGIIMMNPLFNLPYFLIGMYFGFINYTIHKGIIDINMNNQIFKQIHLNNSLNQDLNMIEKLPTIPRLHTFDKNKNRDACQLNLFEKDGENNIPRYNTNSKSNKIIKAQKIKKINKYNRFSLYSINSDNENIEEEDLRESKNQSENLSSDIIQKKKIKDMPFLNSSINIIEWHRNPNNNCFFIIITIIIILILVLLIFSNVIFFLIYKRKFTNNQLKEKLSLEKFNNNIILNHIFLLDIEVFVFLAQWVLFILFMKGQYFFIDFFSSIYWSPFNKSQFSFLIIYSLVILNNFYSSETVVKLNLYNLSLYSCINLFLIAITTIIIYIFIELPMKKIFKYLMKKEYKIVSITEEIDEEEEDEKEDEYENYDFVDKDDDDEEN